MTCCFFSSFKTLLTMREDSALPSNQCPGCWFDGLQLAGFQLTITGGFWVSTEAWASTRATCAFHSKLSARVRTKPGVDSAPPNSSAGSIRVQVQSGRRVVSGRSKGARCGSPRGIAFRVASHPDTGFSRLNTVKASHFLTKKMHNK